MKTDHCKKPYNRSRSRGLYTVPSVDTMCTFAQNGGAPSEPYIYSSSDEIKCGTEMVDVVTPCYERKARRGDWTFSPMEKTVVDAQRSTCGPTRSAYWNGGAKSSVYQYTDFDALMARAFTTGRYVGIDLESDNFNRQRQAAIVQAYANYHDSVAHVLVDAGEAFQTVHMLRHPYDRAVRYFKDVTRRKGYKPSSKQRRSIGDALHETNWSSFSNKAKAVAEVASATYLETTYGWLPTWRAVTDIAKAIEKLEKDIIVVRGRGYGSWDVSDSSENPVNMVLTSYDPTPGPTWTHKHSASVTSEYRAGVVGVVTNSARRAFGLDILDIPSAMWDLVPYSFVVDRFIRIGDWIRAHIPRANAEMKGSWLTRSTTERHHYEIELNSYYNSGGSGSTAWWCTQTPGVCTTDILKVVKEREVGVPPPSLPPVDLKFDVNITNAFDYFSLIFQGLGVKAGQTRAWRL